MCNQLIVVVKLTPLQVVYSLKGLYFMIMTKLHYPTYYMISYQIKYMGINIDLSRSYFIG